MPVSTVADPKIKKFVLDRLSAIAQRPGMWAPTQDLLIVQLVLLAEISWIGTPERFADQHQAMMAALCGPESGCAVPSGPIDDAWARERVDIARRYVAP